MKKFKIDYYDFGEIVINGKVYRQDVIITPKEIISDWWRIEGHRLQLADLQQVLNINFDVLIVGTGYNGLMKVDPEVIEEFKRRGIEVIIHTTKKAVEKYNEMVDKGKKVVGAFHLTC